MGNSRACVKGSSRFLRQRSAQLLSLVSNRLAWSFNAFGPDRDASRQHGRGMRTVGHTDDLPATQKKLSAGRAHLVQLDPPALGQWWQWECGCERDVVVVEVDDEDGVRHLRLDGPVDIAVQAQQERDLPPPPPVQGEEGGTVTTPSAAAQQRGCQEWLIHLP